MLSRSHLHIKRLLEKICKAYGVSLYCELKEGSKKYDFYIPTRPPQVVEVDGQQHKAKKADGHFFKDFDAVMRYRENDEERNRMHKLGFINLYRFEDDYFPSLDEFLEDLGEEFEEILSKGNDEKNAYYKREKQDKEYRERRRREAKESREKAKKRNSSRA